jgi:hypothetical protein
MPYSRKANLESVARTAATLAANAASNTDEVSSNVIQGEINRRRLRANAMMRQLNQTNRNLAGRTRNNMMRAHARAANYETRTFMGETPLSANTPSNYTMFPAKKRRFTQRKRANGKSRMRSGKSS